MDYSTVPQEVLDYFKGYTASPFGAWWSPNKNGRYTDSNGYQWIPQWEDGSGLGLDPSNYSGKLLGYRRGEIANEANDPFRAEATNLYYTPDGKFSYVNKDDKGWLNPLTGILAVASLGLGAGALAGAGEVAGAAGAAGAAEGAAAGGSGAFLGEGVASGIGAWDGAMAGAGAAGTAGMGAAGAGFAGDSTAAGYGGLSAGSTSTMGGGASVAGGTAAGGAGGGGFLNSLGNIFGSGGSMSWGDWLTPALQLIGGAYSAHQAGNAADAQIAAANDGIAENRRQFDLVRSLLQPYVSAGTGALGAYQGLSGANGAQAQANEISALENSPQYASLVRQGENAILQNASATGGLRGGNVQGALADYRTNTLSGLIDKQLARYGGLINVGQNSATGTGQAAMNTGQQVAALQQQAGAAEAGGIVAGSNAFTQALGGIGGFYGARGGVGTPPPANPYAGAGYGSGVVYPQPARSF